MGGGIQLRTYQLARWQASPITHKWIWAQGCATTSGNREKKPKSRYSEIEVSAEEISHIIKCENARFHYIGGMYQCQKCKAYVEEKNSERENAEKKFERTLAMEKPRDFLRKIQKSRLDMNIGCEKNLAAEKTYNGAGLLREVRGTCQDKNNEKEESDRRRYIEKCKCRNETTQTESPFRMIGTQTQESYLGSFLAVQKQQLLVDAEDVLNEDQHPEKH
ncbi:hypothetical protein AVEN_231713-1 [Araneus ventricosus]|uniref:Uncharacterized protein n=1 Tax=Araneus ventricosus TaxID=182803 RepID=A0A4Y2SCI6_ARAVE|nr:hypothetical protein AVEN_231713-1 [Araneus ventricosus]